MVELDASDAFTIPMTGYRVCWKTLDLAEQILEWASLLFNDGQSEDIFFIFAF